MILGTMLLTALLSGCSQEATENDLNIEQLAACISEKELVMYGAFWCPHCSDQKALFGDAFELIEYVECDPRDPAGQPDVCLAKEIESYPTWIHPDGRRWEGTQTLEQLSEVSGCTYAAGETAAEPTL